MSADLITIRPRRSLMVTAVLSFLAAMVPIFGVLYWFASARDAIVPVSVVHAIVLAIGAGVLLRHNWLEEAGRDVGDLTPWLVREDEE